MIPWERIKLITISEPKPREIEVMVKDHPYQG